MVAKAMGAAPDTSLLRSLRSIVGGRHVLTTPMATRKFRTGFRYGGGAAAAVVRPGSLVELWRILGACVAADVIIMQAANTGLTGGSTPQGEDYDREIVIISTKRITAIHLIDGGRQVICLAGATLHALEAVLTPIGREPHSVIGSSCLGASVVGGVCNNSGGALVQRGPAFTELALFARISETGELQLVNHLGVDLGGTPEEILERLDRGRIGPADVHHDASRRGSDRDYARRVRDIDAPTPARFNADADRLFETAGCAGRLAVCAVRLDTFRAEPDQSVFYIGTNDPAELTSIRRHVLASFGSLPVSGEYIHRTAFDLARVYGKDMFMAIRVLGMRHLPALFSLKAWADGAALRFRLRPGLADRLLQGLGRLLPEHLPRRVVAFRDRYEHHLILKMTGKGIEEARLYLATILPSNSGDYFECTPEEGHKAFLHRYVVAGAAVRYRALHPDIVEDIIALDVALPRDRREWFETLPPDIESSLSHRLYYGHFFCHVFHHDYVVPRGADIGALEARMLKLLEGTGAEYPAEHNVGQKYKAKPELAAFYKSLDPRNQLNPGLGGTSKRRLWR